MFKGFSNMILTIANSCYDYKYCMIISIYVSIMTNKFGEWWEKTNNLLLSSYFELSGTQLGAIWSYFELAGALKRAQPQPADIWFLCSLIILNKTNNNDQLINLKIKINLIKFQKG